MLGAILLGPDPKSTPFQRVKSDPLGRVAGYVAWFTVGSVVVGPPAVGDWGVGAVAELGLFGAGGEGGGDVVPGGAVLAGVVGELGIIRSAWSMRLASRVMAAMGSPSHLPRRSARLAQSPTHAGAHEDTRVVRQLPEGFRYSLRVNNST